MDTAMGMEGTIHTALARRVPRHSTGMEDTKDTAMERRIPWTQLNEGYHGHST